MFRCPTCVSIVIDPTVARCPVCAENFKRRPPTVLGVGKRGLDKLTPWNVGSSIAVSKVVADPHDEVIDLRAHHARDKSGQTIAAEQG